MSSQLPALPDLPPEYIAYDDGPRMAAVAVAMIVLSVVFVLLRLTSRRIQGLRLEVDDWIIIVGLAPVILLMITSIKLSQNGVGKHLTVVLLTDPAELERSQIVSKFAYTASIAAIKLSILTLYLRLFPTRFTKRVATGLAVTVSIWSLVVVLLALFQCTPIAKAWDTSIHGSCLNLENYFTGVAVTHILLDVLTLCLPIREVKGLQLRPWTKVAVTGIFAAGGFVTIIVLLVPTAIWTDIEIGVGVFCACVPTLRPLVLRLFGGQSRATQAVTKGLTHTGIRGKRSHIISPALEYLPAHGDDRDSFRSLMPHQLRNNGTAERRTNISATPTKTATAATAIPLHSISVHKEIRWEEERR
ncbi:hypothetical protein F5Y17DRAFT_459153 [Xylariaceae sp. FL0594]|nr:hypothetical protein F5Y17DRAFT_459153 [Xylariaceae sp. FL0594]